MKTQNELVTEVTIGFLDGNLWEGTDVEAYTQADVRVRVGRGMSGCKPSDYKTFVCTEDEPYGSVALADVVDRIVESVEPVYVKTDE